MRKLPSGEYLYTSDTRTTGLARLLYKSRIIETSTWMYDDGDMKPMHYQYDRRGGKKERLVEVVFNHERDRIITTVNGETWRMQLQPPVFDKLLYQLAIMKDLSFKQTDISYEIADGGQIKNYTFQYLGSEKINTEMGQLDTIKMVRHKPNERRKTTFWCARDLHYLPVKVENIEQDGRKTMAVIKSLTGLGLTTVH